MGLILGSIILPGLLLLVRNAAADLQEVTVHNRQEARRLFRRRIKDSLGVQRTPYGLHWKRDGGSECKIEPDSKRTLKPIILLNSVAL